MNESQVTKVQACVEKNGLSYLKEKIAITELEPRRSAARFLLAALRDDFKMPIRTVAKKRKAVVFDQPTDGTKPDDEAMRQETVRKLRAFRASGLIANTA